MRWTWRVIGSVGLLAVAGCSVPTVAEPGGSGGDGGDGGSAVDEIGAGAAPSCELWPTLTPPADFDEVCRPDGEDLLVLEASMFAMINVDREEHAEEANFAAPLDYDCVVAQVARIHSYEMCKAGELEHVLDGRDFDGRLTLHLGWELGDEYVLSAENISWHPDLQEAEDAFVEEEPPCDPVIGGHRLNILDRDLRFVGVGHCQCADDPWGNFYVTQDFVTYDHADVTGGNPYCGF